MNYHDNSRYADPYSFVSSTSSNDSSPGAKQSDRCIRFRNTADDIRPVLILIFIKNDIFQKTYRCKMDEFSTVPPVVNVPPWLTGLGACFDRAFGILKPSVDGFERSNSGLNDFDRPETGGTLG